MKAITLNELINKGAIYFKRIEDGFDNYKYYMLEGTEDEIYNKIVDLRNKNGVDNSFVDFYYGTLLEEEKNRIRTLLDNEYIEILDKYKNINEVVYLQLDDDLLKLSCKMNALEALFSTYYFCKIPCTVWGNYNLKYPFFEIDNKK